MPQQSGKVDGSRRPDEFRVRRMCDICGRWYNKQIVRMRRQDGALKCPDCYDKKGRTNE